ncbi:MAG: hypothetical protein KDI63_09955 [Gammaproteobacteria bacterium]|nr:hypothetical protein [Gammaproteobacteria bacterium]
MLKLPTLGILIVLAVTAPQTGAVGGDDPAAQLNPAQQMFFLGNHLKGVSPGSILHYQLQGATQGEAPFTDWARITVTGAAGADKHNMEFEFLSGTRHLDFAPAADYVGNPILIHFLEYDINQMAKATGGRNGYFRNAIRRAFATPVMRPTTIAFAGETLQATEIIVKPFVNDRNIDSFQIYQDKRYEFIFSDQIPGSVYRIHSVVPGENGNGLFQEETLTFDKLEAAG